MLCRELVYKSSGTRWKWRNSSSAGVNEHNSTNWWSAGKPGPWFLDGLTGFAVFWCCLAGALKEATQVAQAVTRLCMCVACTASLPPVQQMPHTCTALSWPLGPEGLLRRKKMVPLSHRAFPPWVFWGHLLLALRGRKSMRILSGAAFSSFFHPQTIEAVCLHRKRSHRKYWKEQLPFMSPLPFSCYFFFFFGGGICLLFYRYTCARDTEWENRSAVTGFYKIGLRETGCCFWNAS